MLINSDVSSIQISVFSVFSVYFEVCVNMEAAMKERKKERKKKQIL